MKKFILPLVVVIAVLAMAGCSEKFDVAAPYKDVTVVYGFLDMKDTAHYIRIQKGFLDQNKSALTMAQNSDSNFYANLNVRIERYSIGGTNAYHDSIHLNKVDLTAEGYPKQAGTFFNAPNYAYKFTDLLDARYFYRLKITNLTTGRTDSSDAPIINENVAGGFNIPVIDDNNINLDGMSFFSILPHRFYTLDGLYYIPSDYNFHDQYSPAGVAQAIITFNWDDVNNATQVHTPQSYDYNLGYIAVSSGGSFEYNVENSSLYNAIATGMGQAPTGITRLINRCDITVYASTPDFNNYQAALAVQGTGLTGSEIAPVYTNIQGQNCVGLFTSRAVHTGKITINSRTVDSLIASPTLSFTNLKGTVY
jgi:hypothetical protein